MPADGTFCPLQQSGMPAHPAEGSGATIHLRGWVTEGRQLHVDAPSQISLFGKSKLAYRARSPRP
jgi:hypothetical protein